MLINNKLWKENNIFDKFLDYINNGGKLLWGDQAVLNITLKDKIKLIDKKYIVSIKKLKKERKENIKGAFKIKNIEKIMNNKILIIDDIYTTGSTLNECSNLLRKNGIKKENIGVLTLAKD